MIKRFLAVVALSAAVVGSSAGVALAQYPPDPQTGAVSSTTVAPGGQVDFAGAGFAPGSKVTVSVNRALYTTVEAGGSSSSALGSSSGAHVATAAFVQWAAEPAAASSASFSVKVTLIKAGSNLLEGAGVDPSGAPRIVTATVMVAAATATKVVASGSSLPFTGSSVIIPGLIIGLTMTAGGFLLLTTVRSRRAGGARS